jgi:hypothetical protein
MRKKLTKSSKVIRYIQKNPDAKAKEVSQATGVPIASVYQVIYRAKAAAPKVSTPMKVIAIATSNKSSKSDMVNHPTHYKAGGIETIDFIEAKNLGYHLGNVVKYVSRADFKGNKLEDLQKAKWYLDRAISNLSKT